MSRCRTVTALAAALCLVLAACGADRTRPGEAARTAPAGAVRVASFNFSESTLLAEIYAQALEAAGIPVVRELDLGPRELVHPALAQGFVDLVPEYLGSALRAAQPAATVDPRDPVAVRRALADALAPARLEVLSPAPAQDQNGFAMTRRRAGALGIGTLSDLRPHAAGLVLGGPPECVSRPLCLIGLRQVYGLHFAEFVPLATQALEATALEQGVIDVAVVFTTEGRLASADIVLLDDDRRLQPAENIVPVVSSRAVARYGATLTRTLDGVSAQLTSANLRFLNWRVDVAGRDVAAEANGWLRRHPLP